MVRLAAAEQIANMVRSYPSDTPEATIEAEIEEQMPVWRSPEESGTRGGYGYWLVFLSRIRFYIDLTYLRVFIVEFDFEKTGTIRRIAIGFFYKNAATVPVKSPGNRESKFAGVGGQSCD